MSLMAFISKKSPKVAIGGSLVCEAARYGTLTHHSFRHWFATLALEKTGDAKQVADWLGHSDGGKLVWALYSHLRANRTAELHPRRNSLPPDNLRANKWRDVGDCRCGDREYTAS